MIDKRSLDDQKKKASVPKDPFQTALAVVFLAAPCVILWVIAWFVSEGRLVLIGVSLMLLVGNILLYRMMQRWIISLTEDEPEEESRKDVQSDVDSSA